MISIDSDCLGEGCKQYMIYIFPSGQVLFEGYRNVKTIGAFRLKISPAVIKQITELVDQVIAKKIAVARCTQWEERALTVAVQRSGGDVNLLATGSCAEGPDNEKLRALEAKIITLLALQSKIGN